MLKKRNECEHDFTIIDKWQYKEVTYYEFYCRYCLEIIIRQINKKDEEEGVGER